MTVRLRNATIQLFNHTVIHNPKKVITNLALLRTETLDTTQDMPVERKNINVICPYSAGIMQTLIIFVRSWLDQLAIVN